MSRSFPSMEMIHTSLEACKNGPSTVAIHYGVHTVSDHIGQLAESESWQGDLFPSPTNSKGHVHYDTLTSSSAFTRRNPATGFQAERSGLLVSRRIRSKRHLLVFSIGLAVLWPSQRGPIRSRVIVTSLLPGSPVALAVTLSTTVGRCLVKREK